MAKGDYPSVYVVDSHASWPLTPPRLSQGGRRVRAAQTLLFLLVSLALCCMAIEACFIYRLYQSESAASASFSQPIAGEDITSATVKPSLVFSSKPVAHLTDGQDVVHGSQIMAWSMDQDRILHEMDYKEKCLVIQKEGYYYVYSKVSFFDTDVFHHSVHRKTKQYIGKSIPLLTSRKYSEGSRKTRSNSYLGGVFHLYKDDALFVKVSNASKILRYKTFENIFGAYMI